jgi:Family of unknown function (DUF6011)
VNNEENSMAIIAKFDGRCTKCGGHIYAGKPCEWVRGVGVSHTGTCPRPDYWVDDAGRANTGPEPGIDDEARANSGPVNGNGNGRVAVTMGVFRRDGRIYVVKPNKEKTRCYAKEIIESPPRMTEAGEVVDFETVYRPGLVYNLQESDRWPLADAAKFLTKYARCIVCGRHLKAAKSVATSIGPVCSKYFG